MVLAAGAALAAAAVFAASTALLHRSAGLVSDRVGRGQGLGRFISQTAVHPVWLLGMVGQVAGFALHALALRSGPLTLVQPLMVTEVVFALPLRQLLERRWPGRGELAWAGALSCGLALFLVSATPTEGPVKPPDTVPTLVAVLGTAAGMALMAALGRGTEGRFAAGCLAVGAGLGFAGTAGLLKEVTTELGQGAAGVFGNWPVYALAVAGAGGILLTQLAYRAAPLRTSLPAMTTVDVVVSLAIGVAVFDEPFQVSALALAGELAGLLVVIVGLVALTGSSSSSSSASSRGRRSERGGPSREVAGSARAVNCPGA